MADVLSAEDLARFEAAGFAPPAPPPPPAPAPMQVPPMAPMAEYQGLPAPPPAGLPQSVLGLHGQPIPAQVREPFVGPPSGAGAPHEVLQVQRPQAPRPVARGPMRQAGPPPPPIPEDLQLQHGGLYAPPGLDRSAIEQRRLAGRITDQQAQVLEAQYAQHEASLPGKMLGRQRAGMEFEQARGERAVEGAEEGQQFAQLQDAVQANAAERAREMQQERETQRREFNEAYRGQMGAYKAEADDIAQGKVEAGMDTGQGLLAAFGSFLLGYTGKPQIALSQVQRIVQNNMAAQKATLANRRAGLAVKDNLLNRMRSVFHDDRSADLATEANMLRSAQRDLNRIGTLAGSAEKKRKAEELGQGLQFMIDDRERGLDIQAKSAADQIRLAQAQARAQPRQLGQSGKPMKGMVYVPQLKGFAHKDVANKLGQAIASNESIQSAILKLREMDIGWAGGKAREAGDVIGLGGDTLATAQALEKSILLDLAVQYKLGALSEGDKAEIGGLIQAPWTSGGKARLVQVGKLLNGKVEAFKRSANVIPGVERREVDAKGNVVTKHYYQPSE